MDSQNISAGKFALNYGVILGLIMVLIGIIMYVSGMALEGVQWPNYLYYIIFPVIIFYTISLYKRANGNVLSIGDALKTGLVVAVVSALVYSVYVLIFNYLIDPEFMGEMMKVAEEKLMENENMSPELVEQQMEFIRKFSNPGLGIAFWIAMSAFFGLIYSVIGGLVMKQSAPNA